MHRNGGPKAGHVEKRNAQRIPARGTVRIQLDMSPGGELTGELIDISDTGFRAVHAHQALAKGDTVRFQHATGSGVARIVWNRITADSVETGFVVL